MLNTKTTITLLSLLFATACSTTKFKRTLDSDNYDLLSDESMMRYNPHRFKSSSEIKKKDFISQALLACHENKFAKGLNLLTKNLNKNKNNPFFWNALGNCYYLKNDNEKAVFYYNLGLEASNHNTNKEIKNITSAIVNNNIGLIHLKNKRFTEAFELFQKASKDEKNYFTPKFNMAQVYLEFNKTNEALKLLHELEKANHLDIDLLYCLSLAYFRQNNFDKSFEYVSKINSNYLNQPDIVGLYAYNLMNKGRLSEAKQILEKRMFSIEFDSRNKEILNIVNQKIKEKSKD